jgi:YVTN family beta-propeller protein
VSIIEPSMGTLNTVKTGFTAPAGILYDGANIWVTDFGAGKLFKLDPNGNIIQTVTVGVQPSFPVFDGANIWVPNSGNNSITVVQASSGNVAATIPSVATNPLSTPTAASFDGERILVTNRFDQSVSVFREAHLSFVANASLSDLPFGACSDGINFWITYLTAGGGLLRL